MIIDAREAGLMWETNQACEDLLQSDSIQSVGVVATGPWLQDFADWHKKHPRHDIGLSIALTNPYQNPRWDFVSPRTNIPTLVDGEGNPWRSVMQIALSANAEDVERELHAQLYRAKSAGISVSHLNGYYGTVFSRPDFVAVLLAVSRKHWIPVPLVELTPERLERFRGEGIPLDDALTAMIASHPLPKLDELEFMPVDDDYDAKLAKAIQMIKSLKPGLTQIVARPAMPSPGVKRLGDGWQQRVWDVKVLQDKQFKDAIAEQGIVLTNWREVMARFEGRPSDRPAAPSTASDGRVVPAAVSDGSAE